jgi:hypothetical protein
MHTGWSILLNWRNSRHKKTMTSSINNMMWEMNGWGEFTYKLESLQDFYCSFQRGHVVTVPNRRFSYIRMVSKGSGNNLMSQLLKTLETRGINFVNSIDSGSSTAWKIRESLVLEGSVETTCQSRTCMNFKYGTWFSQRKVSSSYTNWDISIIWKATSGTPFCHPEYERCLRMQIPNPPLRRRLQLTTGWWDFGTWRGRRLTLPTIHTQSVAASSLCTSRIARRSASARAPASLQYLCWGPWSSEVHWPCIHLALWVDTRLSNKIVVSETDHSCRIVVLSRNKRSQSPCNTETKGTVDISKTMISHWYHSSGYKS